MTLDYAKRILEHPKFGDPACIAARERLDREPECQRLRALVFGRSITCGPCGGGGCKMCHSMGFQIIGKSLAESWDLDILQGVAEELALEPSPA